MNDCILYNDKAIIVLNKPSSIPTQPDLTGDISLLQLTEEFLNEKLYLVHRLDRVASGLVVFAKTPEAAAALSTQFQLKKTQKRYWAIVENKPPKETDILVHFLKKNAKTNISKAFDTETKDAKRAELRYILRGVSDRYMLLEIELFTGRHHQIRVQLAKTGCSIKGDVKYGARRSNANRSIHLHAWKLQFEHPISRESLVFQCEPDMTDRLWAVMCNMDDSSVLRF